MPRRVRTVPSPLHRWASGRRAATSSRSSRCVCRAGARRWPPSSTTPPTAAGSPGPSSARSAQGSSGGRSPTPRSAREAGELAREVLARRPCSHSPGRGPCGRRAAARGTAAAPRNAAGRTRRPARAAYSSRTWRQYSSNRATGAPAPTGRRRGRRPRAVPRRPPNVSLMGCRVEHQGDDPLRQLGGDRAEPCELRAAASAALSASLVPGGSHRVHRVVEPGPARAATARSCGADPLPRAQRVDRAEHLDEVGRVVVAPVRLAPPSEQVSAEVVDDPASAPGATSAQSARHRPLSASIRPLWQTGVARVTAPVGCARRLWRRGFPSQGAAVRWR